MSKTLIYTVMGLNRGFIECLDIFCKSLEYHNDNIDLLLITDKSFEDDCICVMNKYKINSKIKCFPDCTTPIEALSYKLKIFECDIDGYDKLLYIDTDCIINGSIQKILDTELKDDKFYVYYEHDHNGHKIIYWTIPNYYSIEDMYEMIKNNIYPFNAGLFYLLNTPKMKEHFDNLYNMIKNNRHSEETFYMDQSYFNCYFNKLLKTDGTIFTKQNYKLFASADEKQKELILHYCGHPGDGHTKSEYMNKYWDKFGPKKIK